MEYVEEGDVLRYCVDVISNLASHQEECNKYNTESMLKDGVVDIILTVIKKNPLNTDILGSCIDALDGLI